MKSINPISKNAKEIPFNVNEWGPSTGRGKNYYANRYWKVELRDSDSIESIKWVNSGHLFLSQMYFYVRDNNSIEEEASA